MQPADRIKSIADGLVAPAIYTSVTALPASVHQTPDRIRLEEARRRPFVPIVPGFRWGPVWSTAWFRITGRVPTGMAGRTVVLRFDTGTEALLWMDGAPYQGFDRNRDAAILFEHAAGGEPIDLLVEAACNHPLGVATTGLFWEPPEFHARWSEASPGRLDRCELAAFNDGVWRLYRTLEFARQLVEQLPADSARAVQLAAAIDAALAPPSPANVAARAREACEAIATALHGQGSSSPPRCFAVGHAHLDTAWLWPVAETKRKALRTFATALRLMDRFPDFRFLCSQPQQYAWVRELSPALFDQIGARVREGRWQPMGAMWVEPDGSLPSGESFVRQILHGTRYWRDAFGDHAPQRLVYLPDTFGFAASLPQVFRLAGLDTFITNKLWWNDTTQFPHTHFRWRGIDGTEVLSHLTPGQEYNATNTPAELRKGEAMMVRKDSAGVGVWLQPFGYGDGGGGPTDWTILNARLAEGRDGLPRTNLEGAAAFCDELHRRAGAYNLPIVEGELYLQRHRGTYTTQARVKQANARAEAALRVAEWLTFAGPASVPTADRATTTRRLDEAWKLTLLNQFHDILPGSSIAEVYADAARGHEQVRATCDDLLRSAEQGWAAAADTTGMSEPMLVFNPGSTARSAWVEWGDAARRGVYARDVPAVGVAVIDAAAAPQPTPPPTLRDRTLSNGIIEATIDDVGRAESLGLVATGLDLAAEPLNQLVLYEDRPAHWDAWDIDADYLNHAEPITSPAESIRIDDTGIPGRLALRVERPLGRASRLVQTYSLAAGSPRLDIRTRIDWHEEHRLLRALFPTGIRAGHATYEIPFGQLQRPTGRCTPEERAMFEVPAHRWMDLSEPGRGLAVLNECKYGHSCHGSVMGVSLLRSPKWPDPAADMGEHDFTYSLMPHAGDWRAAGVDAEAEHMVQPMWAVPVRSGRTGPTRGSWSPVTIATTAPASVRVTAIKRAEDDDRLILRLVECHGRAGSCTIGWRLAVGNVRPVDLLERPRYLPGFAHDRAARRSTFSLRPFQIVTIAADVTAP